MIERQTHVHPVFLGALEARNRRHVGADQIPPVGKDRRFGQARGARGKNVESRFTDRGFRRIRWVIG